jgi:osmotically-inducible protein OsmY
MVDFLLVALEEAELNQSLVQQVKHVLHVLHIPALRSLDVQVKNNIVTLRGRVRSFYHRQVARTAIARVPGVTRVVDELEVEPLQRGEFRPPTTLSRSA